MRIGLPDRQHHRALQGCGSMQQDQSFERKYVVLLESFFQVSNSVVGIVLRHGDFRTGVVDTGRHVQSGELPVLEQGIGYADPHVARLRGDAEAISDVDVEGTHPFAMGSDIGVVRAFCRKRCNHPGLELWIRCSQSFQISSMSGPARAQRCLKSQPATGHGITIIGA